MRKSFIVLIILLLISVTFNCYAQGPLSETENDMFNYLKQSGFEKSYVMLRNNSLIIKFQTIIDHGILKDFYDISTQAGETASDIDFIILDAYVDQDPFLRVNIKAADARAAAVGNMSREDYISGFEFMDLRPVDRVLEDELAEYDTKVYFVHVGNRSARVDLAYNGLSQEQLFSDYISMSMAAVENCPWIDRINFNFISNDDKKVLVMTSGTDDILNLYADDISVQEFFYRTTLKEFSKNSLGFYRIMAERQYLDLYNKAQIPVIAVSGIVILAGIILIVKILRKIFGRKSK